MNENLQVSYLSMLDQLLFARTEQTAVWNANSAAIYNGRLQAEAFRGNNAKQVSDY